eukprot:365048-Chlamydomonas_euryale.AAC.6
MARITTSSTALRCCRRLHNSGSLDLAGVGGWRAVRAVHRGAAASLAGVGVATRRPGHPLCFFSRPLCQRHMCASRAAAGLPRRFACALRFLVFANWLPSARTPRRAAGAAVATRVPLIRLLRSQALSSDLSGRSICAAWSRRMAGICVPCTILVHTVGSVLTPLCCNLHKQHIITNMWNLFT